MLNPQRSARVDAGRDLEAVFGDLGRIVLGDAPLTQVLQQVAELASQALPDAVDVSVTMLDGGANHRPPSRTARSVAFARHLAVKLDERQYESGFGPCLDAAWSGETIRVDAYGADERYREFAAACRAAGVPESLSIGLPVRHRTAVGALNVYGGPFTDEDVELAVALAGHAAVAVANAALYQSMADLAENLQVAMQSRAVIEQAKGIIMARRNGSPDQAFEWLRVRSQHANVKVRDIAQRIVDARGG